MKKLLKQILQVALMTSIITTGLLVSQVAFAQNEPIRTQKDSDQFEVSKILKLPGQDAPKFLDDLNSDDGNKQVPVVRAIVRIIDFAMLIMGSFAFLVMVAGGVVMVTSAGNDQRTEQGKNMVIYSLVGLIVAFSSFIISTFVQSVVTGQ